MGNEHPNSKFRATEFPAYSGIYVLIFKLVSLVLLFDQLTDEIILGVLDPLLNESVHAVLQVCVW